ncbi:DUF159-domain-containing protein [Poronia punctata]|nr:DUF159-domain-containing protein [Poronia punctata]
MCGRYAMALRPSQIRRRLRDDGMPVDEEAPDYPAEEEDENENDDDRNGPRQSYNFAPGYRGVVYRADVPDRGAGPGSRQTTSSTPAETEDDAGKEEKETHYKLQTMTWGLIPFWTKRNPGYGSVMKTINCRDDSLAHGGGMWGSMKGKKRCVVLAQGFYEWLKKNGGRDKLPHFVKRMDGKLMCFAGLWDVVQYENEDEKRYTYTIITTDSNKQLNFLHDRMPVILENGSEKLRKWLDPNRYEWSKELQSLLRPFDGELEVYPVSKDVGKVGNNSPTFIIPVDSKENKSNIANFFAKAPAKKDKDKDKDKDKAGTAAMKEEDREEEFSKGDGFVDEDRNDNVEAKLEGEEKEEEKEKGRPVVAGVKREAEDSVEQEPPKKKVVQQSIDELLTKK